MIDLFKILEHPESYPHRAFILSSPCSRSRNRSLKKLSEYLLNNQQNHGSSMLWFDTKKEKISIERMRIINQFANKTSYKNSPKIVVIEVIDDLNTFAANALLKTLEESDCFFILISLKVISILPTIRSRCIHVKLGMDPKITLNQSTTQEIEVIERRGDKDYDFYLSKNDSKSGEILDERDSAQFYEQMLRAIAVFHTNAQVLNDFIVYNFSNNEEECKWTTFKILISHFIIRLMHLKAVVPTSLQHETELAEKLSKDVPMLKIISLYDKVSELMHWANTFHLSRPNVALLVFYKIIFLGRNYENKTMA